MKTKLFFNLILFVVLSLPLLASAQTNEFTYQGRLTDSAGNAASYDFQFTLYTASINGIPLASRDRLGVPVSNGAFIVTLDFPPANFTGFDRWLEIKVKPAGSANPYTTLSPRQKITSSPYSIRSLNATSADNSLQLGGIGASGFVQNTTAPQTANFNVTGNGTIGGDLTVGGTLSSNIVNAQTQYNISGNRVLSVKNNTNTFLGVDAGIGSLNGIYNTFVGNSAGKSHTTGDWNSIFGGRSGGLLSTGCCNSIFGEEAGVLLVSGSGNSFVGLRAGERTTGSSNTFVGRIAGIVNSTGSNNTVIGNAADVGSGDLSYATAIGADAMVNSSNTVVLGRSEDTVRVPGELVIANISSGGSTALCRTSLTLKVGTCSSSLRYKTNIKPFNFGLGLVNRLKPITFDWKEGSMADLGLGAEDVAAVEPLLVTYNKTGEVEGVKYDRIGVVLLNAVKEQQTQIENQQTQIQMQNNQIKEQQNQAVKQEQQIREQKKQLQQQQFVIDGLRALVCSQNPQAEVCKEMQK